MTKIDDLIAQSRAALRLASGAGTQSDRDRHVMRSERLLDKAWQLNEADAALPPLESGLWCARGQMEQRAA